VLDAGFVAYVGFQLDGQPAVIPTLHARVGDRVLIHGSSASRLVTAVRAQGELDVCLNVTIVDGIVMARSALQHSINYRSVVLYSPAREITDPPGRIEALEAFMEGVIPGRWPHVRPPSPSELKATGILALPIREGAAKVRGGGPDDLEEDADLDGWGGVLPLRLVAEPPITDSSLPGPERPVPEHVMCLAERLGLERPKP
jgi:nitroimidazol reductase NimA-like FMN-containing flavoprotein (pyridoxamine 5'-phosphate oxidase superfamily)